MAGLNRHRARERYRSTAGIPTPSLVISKDLASQAQEITFSPSEGESGRASSAPRLISETGFFKELEDGRSKDRSV